MAVLPAPKSPADLERWTHTRLRRRMLTGCWAPDLIERTKQSLGAVRADAIKRVDSSSNPLASTCVSLSVLYDVEPRILHPDATAAAQMTTILGEAGWSAMMQEHMRLCLGLREMLLRVDCAPQGTGHRIMLRSITPDVVVARARRGSPADPAWVHEARLEDVAQLGTVGVWEVIDPERRVYAILDEKGGDLTRSVHGETFTGDAYPWEDEAGNAILPIVLYHARVGATLWDHTAWAELVEGTFESGVDRTAYHHNLRNAAWAQRWAVGAKLPSDETGAARRSTVVADPSTILLFERSDPDQPAQIGSFAVPFDPKVFQEAVSEDERRLIAAAGVPEADVLRASADPRSGVALVQDRDARDRAARRFEAPFRQGDRKLLTVVAQVWDSAGGTPRLPETGWDVEYQPLPETEAERSARVAGVLAQLTAGLISKAEARAAIRGETLDEAKKALESLNG